MFIAGATDPIKQAFARSPTYQLARRREPGRVDAERLRRRPASRIRAVSSHARRGAEPSRSHLATDSWPFLYLRRPMIPALSLRGMARDGARRCRDARPVPAAIARGRGAPRRASPAGLLAQMALLGAGFMLIETRAVVQMALAVRRHVARQRDRLLRGARDDPAARTSSCSRSGRDRSRRSTSRSWCRSPPASRFRSTASSASRAASRLPRPALLAFTPVLFARRRVRGVVRPRHRDEPGVRDERRGRDGRRARGYSSMLLGFQHVTVLALAFYALSWISVRRSGSPRQATVRGIVAAPTPLT